MAVTENPSSRTCLVTGASGGIGRALVRQLVAAGDRVICVARDLDRLRAAIDDSRAEVYCAALDVTAGDAVTDFVSTLPEAWRTIDVLFANAGSDVGGRRDFLDGEVEDWVGTVDTNVNGVVRVCHAVLPAMVERGQGHVITIGSTAGLKTYPGGAAYAASKHAVRAFTDTLRLEHKHSPIRITEILPGTVRTDFARARHRGDEDRAAAFYDGLPGTLEPDDVAAAVLYALNQPSRVNIAQVLVTPTLDK